MQIVIKNKDTLLYDEFKFKCAIGKNGAASIKYEGDRKTPKGIFSLGPVYYRKDRILKFQTKLQKIKITRNMGWCDDVNSEYYNRLFKIKNNVRHEKLHIKKRNYDLLIPIKYNFSKIIKQKGSAIFLHLTTDYKQTLGCIALKKKDMLILLKLINRKTKIKII